MLVKSSSSRGEADSIGRDTTYLNTSEVFPISSANRATHVASFPGLPRFSSLICVQYGSGRVCSSASVYYIDTIEMHTTQDGQWTGKLSTAWNDLCTFLCRVKRSLSVVPRVWWCLNGVCGRVSWFFILPWVTVSGVYLRTEWRTRGGSGLKNLGGRGGKERRKKGEQGEREQEEENREVK